MVFSISWKKLMVGCAKNSWFKVGSTAWLKDTVAVGVETTASQKKSDLAIISLNNASNFQTSLSTWTIPVGRIIRQSDIDSCITILGQLGWLTNRPPSQDGLQLPGKSKRKNSMIRNLPLFFEDDPFHLSHVFSGGRTMICE